MSIRALAAAATVAAAAVVAIPAMSTAAPVATPAIIITPRPTITFHPLPPDLTIGRAGGCTWYRGAEGDVWINPTIEAYGTGLFLPAHTSFNMVSNWDKHTAGGSLVPNVAQTWAIDIGPASYLPALGHWVTLTLNVDPTHEVTESNESNNTGYIYVDLTAYTSPPGITETAVPCS